MAFAQATRVTITVEQLNETAVVKLVEDFGATGYSVFNGGGKGAHGLHPVHRASVADGFAIVKVEAIMADRAQAEALAEEITQRILAHHAGIIYLDVVEVLRQEKFGPRG